jgi:hypothetical protein
MIKKSKLLKTIDPCLKLFGLFGFPDVFISRRWNRIEKFSIVFAILKFIIALGVLHWFIYDSVFGQIESLFGSKNIAIHLINFFGNSLQAIIPLIQSAVCLRKFDEVFCKFFEIDELFLNFLHAEINYHHQRRRLFITASSAILVHTACASYVGLSALRVNPFFLKLVFYYFTPLILGCIFVQRFCFVVQILTIYFNEMRRALEKSINNRVAVKTKEDWKWQSSTNYHKIVVLRRVHVLLWQCSTLINDCFSFALVEIFAMFFLSSVYRGFLLCGDVIEGHSKDHRQFIALFHILFAILNVHYNCEQCSKSVIMR